MFTGIVEGTGTVVTATDDEGGRRLRIAADGLDDLHHGQSISVSGVCLTVERFGHDAENDLPADASDWFEVFLAGETVAKTYLGDVQAGDTVNVERALAADGRFDGHVVQGHVDGTTEVTEIERVGDDWYFEFDLPTDLARYVVQKGSITLDGISLTVADRRESGFAVAIIPTTYELTTLSEKSVGDPVHVEVDVIAKYVENMIEGYRERIVEDDVETAEEASPAPTQ
ncbi:riboflavin synthase [Salinirubrum litoreum]|uniref:Riboflavin synthase n=1 Tax=Salinirubrum litoreum TaxID=1126234 RepID=A0ABD5REG9_9EURY|nr:riboflavin synthase [Salinirubrum litoreum]